MGINKGYFDCLGMQGQPKEVGGYGDGLGCEDDHRDGRGKLEYLEILRQLGRRGGGTGCGDKGVTQDNWGVTKRWPVAQG